uniref:Uncharacterized protein n=1 Tax=Anguilla anguilla TaxID=7936 RepID=A0A0E9UT86_ANGAN
MLSHSNKSNFSFYETYVKKVYSFNNYSVNAPTFLCKTRRYCHIRIINPIQCL